MWEDITGINRKKHNQSYGSIKEPGASGKCMAGNLGCMLKSARK